MTLDFPRCAICSNRGAIKIYMGKVEACRTVARSHYVYAWLCRRNTYEPDTRTPIQYSIFVRRCHLFTYNLLTCHPKPSSYRSFPYQQLYCERSEPTSVEERLLRAWRAKAPLRLREAGIAGQFLAVGQNLALQKTIGNEFVLCIA